MALTAYRVTRATHPLFDGTGATRFGARWTSTGQIAIYTAGSYAGALLEILVHARRLTLREPYHAMVIHVPNSVSMTVIRAADVPGWDAPDYVASRAVGDAWLARADSAVLQVPSLTGWPHEINIIINPRHPDTQQLGLGTPHAVMWDERLIRAHDA